MANNQEPAHVSRPFKHQHQNFYGSPTKFAPKNRAGNKVRISKEIKQQLKDADDGQVCS